MKRLETERLILRDWTMDDVADLFEYAKSDKVGPNAGWNPHESIEESQAIIEMFMSANDVWAIQLKDGGKVIGGIGIHDRRPDETIIDKKQKEIGYVLNPDYWGKGYMPEAVERAKSYCFEELGVEIIWCGHYDYNPNSKRVIDKTGFHYKFTKETILTRLDDKKVQTLFYNIEK